MEEKASVTAWSVGLRYGLILSLVSIIFSLIQTALGANPLDQGWQAYLSIVFVIIVVVLAHKYFKENGDGYMSYGQGFGIAFITLVISIIIAGLYTYVYAKYVDTTLMDQVWEKTRQKMEDQGQSEENIEMGLGLVKKLFWIIYVFGGMFWGLIVGLIVPIFTQKKRPEMI